MKVSRLLLVVAFVSLALFAATKLAVPAPVLAQGGGGRGTPPPVIPTPTAEAMNEDPQTETMRNDRMGFPAFKIIGNLYYIGTISSSSFLITTPQGNMVINAIFEETLPLLKRSVESLGFKLADTKILLASHAHADHQAADAMFKEMTGAQTMFMEADVPALQRMMPGGKPHPIDRVLHDGDTVTLGGMTLTAHWTPGHTAGCTTWTFPVTDAGRTYNVTIVCGGLPDDARLVYNTNQPDLADQWLTTINKWKTYPTDVFLGAHSWFFNLTGKYKRMKANPRVNPWIDPDGYKKFIADTEALRAKLLAEQTAAGPPPPRPGRGPGN